MPSSVYNHSDKTWGKSLQVVHNACIHFITGYVPFIPAANVHSHITHLNFVGSLSQVASTGFVLPHGQYIHTRSPFQMIQRPSLPSATIWLFFERRPGPFQLWVGPNRGMEYVFHNKWAGTSKQAQHNKIWFSEIFFPFMWYQRDSIPKRDVSYYIQSILALLHELWSRLECMYYHSQKKWQYFFHHCNKSSILYSWV